MKKLLNFGVPDPLILGMAHPVADRLETLGRARPATWRSRCLALSAMSVIALSTAPLSIAADHPEHESSVKSETRFKFLSSVNGKKGQSYEIVTEDGVKKAYRLLEGGKRKEVDLTKKDDGSYQLTYDDGQIIDLPNLDEDAIESLRGLASLEALEGLKGLKALKSLESLSELSSLKDLKDLEGLEISDGNIQVFTLGDKNLDTSEHSKMLDKFPEKIRKMLASKGGANSLHIIREGDSVKWLSDNHEGRDVFGLDDTVVDSRFEFFKSSDPLETAQRQLERTKQHLEALSDNESVSFDLKNALRDIESAQKSLEEAESRLLDQIE